MVKVDIKVDIKSELGKLNKESIQLQQQLQKIQQQIQGLQQQQQVVLQSLFKTTGGIEALQRLNQHEGNEDK